MECSRGEITQCPPGCIFTVQRAEVDPGRQELPLVAVALVKPSIFNIKDTENGMLR